MSEYKKNLTIQEVSQRLNVPKHTLRFWEKELEDLICPLRTRGGQRRYTVEHLFILEEIMSLKQKGLSLAAIKRELNGIKKRFDRFPPHSKPQRIELLADQLAEVVRSTVQEFFEEERREFETVKDLRKKVKEAES